MSGDVEIRRIGPDDLDALALLCVAHAAYERAPRVREPDRAALLRALSGVAPRLFGWLAAERGEPLGYATAALEFSTWSAREHLHMDCLFVREDARGAGIGARLVDEILACARELGVAEIQWQTPDWNADAIRFYLRRDASMTAKRRFSLAAERTTCRTC